MDHRGKLRVADEIGGAIGSKFGDAIVVGLLSGSVARGEDTEHSDLEVVFVTKDRIRKPGMSPAGYREFLLEDLQTQIEFRTKEEVISERLTHVGQYWPFHVWIFLEPHVFYGDREVVDATVREFRHHVASLPDSVSERRRDTPSCG